jgi:hypothetical protein
MHSRRSDGSVIEFSIKGGIFRGLVFVLKEDDKLRAVEELLSGETLALVRSLPTTGAWVDGVRMLELEEAIAQRYDSRGVMDVARRSMAVELRANTRSLTEGILRLFGATPASLFSRVSTFDPLTLRGVQHSWTSKGPKSGEIRARYVTSKNLPEVLGYVAAGMLNAVFDMVRATGSVEFVGVAEADRNVMVYAIQWD